MAAGSNNVDLFDAYFRRADLDRDGRISGQEAVAFFQGSGLPKEVLAKIWGNANQSQSGYLGRTEFYNALKLVTVAQSKRELTPDIVKAALYGPASSKIPAPQIIFTSSSTPTPPPAAPTPAPAPAPTPTPVAPPPIPNPNVGLRGPSPNPQGGVGVGGAVSAPVPSPAVTVASAGGLFPQSTAGGAISASVPPPAVATRGGPLPQSTAGGHLTQSALTPISTSSSLNALPPSQPHHSVSPSSNSSSPLPKSLHSNNNNGAFPASHSFFGGGNQPSTATTTTTTATRNSLPPAAAAAPQLQHNHHTPPLHPQSPWPRITQSDIQKYSQVFIKVDTDRDGKITGEQARNLFLSWRLPREVLKQVWDLSDQDNDSMLSLREFCIALYLMERHREGRVLPGVLPSNIMLDLPPAGQPSTHHGTVGWGNQSGFQQQQQQQQQQQVVTGSVTRPVNPNAGRPPRPAPAPQPDDGPQNKPPKSKVPVLEKHLIDQLSSEEQSSINSKFQEASEADKKVEELEKEIVESREKIEFYRTKMQEIVLYKSRCDNRLNEVIERISADKQEVEILAKKYEAKYKQVGDVSSRLTTEEATFRDIQEKKIELYQAIVKLEQQDGNADGSLQANVDHIQSELDELVKSLNERCKKYGLRAKPTTLVELPFGWQAGIQEGAADWDEDWDKLEDQEYAFVKEFTLDVQNVIAPPKQKLPSDVNIKTSDTDSPKLEASPKNDEKSEKPQHEEEAGNGSIDNKSEDGSAKSAPNSPLAKTAIASPHRDSVDSDIRKTAGEDSSPRDQDTIQETQSDHSGAKSAFSGEQIFDEPNWGTFDTTDDVDSVWGFNASSSTKEERDLDRGGDSYFFDSGELGLNPIKTGSPQAGDPFPKRSGFSFDDSVPSTPLFSSSSSPQKPKEWSGIAFDSFSRFDSFRTHDSSFSTTWEAPQQFDSTRGSTDFDHVHGFPAFDDSDPFGSGPFKTSSESQTPRRSSDNWSAF